MRKIFFFLILLLLSNLKSYSCNVCGGSSGGSYFGVLPQLYKNFIGIRYTSKSFSYKAAQPSTIGAGNLKSEAFNTVEFWGRFYPKKRVQVFYFIPFSFNERKEDTRNVSIDGIGDISFLLNYTVIKRSADSLKLSHNLMLGGGVQLPTGKYQQRDINKTMFPLSFQVATGAYALQSNFIYTIRYKKFGLNTNATYRYNFENELFYQLGSQINISGMFFFWQKLSPSITVLPQTGLFYEQFGKDMQFGILKNETGGNNLFYNLGLDVYLKRIVLGGVVLMPIASEVSPTLPNSKMRFMLNLSYLFE